MIIDNGSCLAKGDDLPYAPYIEINNIPSAPSVLASLPTAAQETHVVYTKTQKKATNENEPWGYFNHTSCRPQEEPPISLINLRRAEWDKNQFSISTGSESVWVDIVLNNLDDNDHPFYLVS